MKGYMYFILERLQIQIIVAHCMVSYIFLEKGLYRLEAFRLFPPSFVENTEWFSVSAENVHVLRDVKREKMQPTGKSKSILQGCAEAPSGQKWKQFEESCIFKKFNMLTQYFLTETSARGMTLTESKYCEVGLAQK